jgi:hypothetical protein
MYLVFNHNCRFLGEFKTMHEAQSEAVLYIGQTGNPAHVTTPNLLTTAERDSYDQFLEIHE